MAAQPKKASIVIVGVPWNDERLHNMGGPATPQRVKEGIDTIDKLMKENGFGKYTAVQYVPFIEPSFMLKRRTNLRQTRASDKTGLDEFKNAIKAEKRDALFLGGGLREGGMFHDFREEVIAVAKVSIIYHDIWAITNRFICFHANVHPLSCRRSNLTFKLCRCPS